MGNHPRLSALEPPLASHFQYGSHLRSCWQMLNGERPAILVTHPRLRVTEVLSAIQQEQRMQTIGGGIGMQSVGQGRVGDSPTDEHDADRLPPIVCPMQVITRSPELSSSRLNFSS
jgi:hypothetical protein